MLTIDNSYSITLRIFESTPSHSVHILPCHFCTCELRGSSGLGSVNNDEIDRRTFEIVRLADHDPYKISTPIQPQALMLGWKIRVVK